jgi:hypothetical protein
MVIDGKKEFGCSLNSAGEYKAFAWSIYFNEPGNYCAEKGAMIYVLFRNGERLEFTNNNSFNCDGQVSIYFGEMFGRKKQLRKLIEQPIEALRVVGVKESFDQELSEEDANKLKGSFSCMAESVKMKL